MDYAIEYLKEHEQFGHRIAEIQGIEFMIADIEIAQFYEGTKQVQRLIMGRSLLS